jgi:hypothetical protein
MRIAGLALVLLALLHFLLQHFGVTVERIDYAAVARRWSDPSHRLSGILWRGYDLALLLLAFSHGSRVSLPFRMGKAHRQDLGIPYQLRAIQQVRTLPFALLTRSTHGSTRSFARSNAVMAGAKTGCTFVTGTVMAPRCRFRGPIWPRLIRSLSSPLGRLVFVPETCWNSLI